MDSDFELFAFAYVAKIRNGSFWFRMGKFLNRARGATVPLVDESFDSQGVFSCQSLQNEFLTGGNSLFLDSKFSESFLDKEISPLLRFIAKLDP